MAPFSSVLCAVDSSTHAARVVRHAAGLAALSGGHLTLLTITDVTGRHAILELERELAAHGVRFVLAGRQTQTLNWLEAQGRKDFAARVLFFPTLSEAVRAFGRTEAGDQ